MEFLSFSETRDFYRIGKKGEGLWYNKQGEFTGLIHTKYPGLTNSKLEMPFDEELIGFISVADSMEHLFQWFSAEDIYTLQEHGYQILRYSSNNFKFYERFKHNVIEEKSATLVQSFKLNKPIKAPESLSLNKAIDAVKIFLAGSIEMGVAEDWQTTVTKYFEQDPSYQILNPRRDHWDSSWKQEIENPQFYQQVSWEMNAMNYSDVIIMNFCSGTKSPVSMLEFGLYARSRKIFVVCPKDFWRAGNIEIVCEKYNIPLYRTLDDLLNNFKIRLWIST